jgi:hypothetical protein
MLSALVLGAVAVAAVGAACSSDDDKSDSSSSSSNATQVAKGGNLSECDYAKAVVGVMGTFAFDIGNAGQSLNSNSTQADVNKAFDTYGDQIGKLVKDLQGLKVSGDLAKLNTALIGVFQDLQKQIPDLKKSVASDPTKASEAGAKLTSDFEKKLDKVNEQYKSTTDKFDKCGS